MGPDKKCGYCCTYKPFSSNTSVNILSDWNCSAVTGHGFDPLNENWKNKDFSRTTPQGKDKDHAFKDKDKDFKLVLKDKDQD